MKIDLCLAFFSLSVPRLTSSTQFLRIFRVLGHWVASSLLPSGVSNPFCLTPMTIGFPEDPAVLPSSPHMSVRPRGVRSSPETVEVIARARGEIMIMSPGVVDAGVRPCPFYSTRRGPWAFIGHKCGIYIRIAGKRARAGCLVASMKKTTVHWARSKPGAHPRPCNTLLQHELKCPWHHKNS